MTAQGRPESRVAAATALRNNPAVRKCAWESAESRRGVETDASGSDAGSGKSMIHGKKEHLTNVTD
ncbi:hypothetical protein CA606_09175 [Caulobacter vibrioides]|uniref:Uncharacterized protein n=1 Tax=Caulobacter vibrioides TaxID=155892 RepID=A0A290MKB0_CAUVI|nr:hypothetical protein CA606_09175 [Caulobacter vibrioides]